MNGKYVRFKGVYLGDLYINPDYITHISVYNEDPAHPASNVHVNGEKLPIVVRGNPEEIVNDIRKQTW